MPELNWPSHAVDQAPVPLSRLKALAFSDTPAAVKLRMVPSGPSEAELPEKSKVPVLDAAARSLTVPVAL